MLGRYSCVTMLSLFFLLSIQICAISTVLACLSVARPDTTGLLEMIYIIISRLLSRHQCSCAVWLPYFTKSNTTRSNKTVVEGS